MLKIAIIQFPGLNTEYETRREIGRAGMHGEFFRWNEDPKKLDRYDGYVIGGGFSYEDRGRAGIIASLDPIMKAIKTQAELGKPVLGICNGAQILVESGLIPGVDGNKLVMALARNKRVMNNEVLGTGYYNAWVNLKCTAKNETCLFTWNMKEGEMLKAPIAHGEGRFTTDIENLMLTLSERRQIAFRYCDSHGAMNDSFPVNPNGAQFNAAGICNPEGNVLAIMPHLERHPEASFKLFSSMKNGIMARKSGGIKKRVPHLAVKPLPDWPLPKFAPLAKSMQLFVSLIITDNEADTFEMTLRDLGWPEVKLRRTTHIELGIQGKPDLTKTAKRLIQCGILLNTNKEFATVFFGKEKLFFDVKREKFLPALSEERTGTTLRLLVREKSDFVAVAKLATLQKRLKFAEISDVRLGTLWEITLPTKSAKVAEEELKRMGATHLFFNPHRQEALLIS